MNTSRPVTPKVPRRKRTMSKREEGALQACIIAMLIAGETLPGDYSRLFASWLSDATLNFIARQRAMGRHVARRLRAGEPLPGMCGPWLADLMVGLALKDHAAGKLG